MFPQNKISNTHKTNHILATHVFIAFSVDVSAIDIKAELYLRITWKYCLINDQMIKSIHIIKRN